MRLDLYQAETARIAAEQTAILDEAQHILASGKKLSGLEQNGILHALQVLIENAIGKVKERSRNKLRNRLVFLPVFFVV